MTEGSLGSEPAYGVKQKEETVTNGRLEIEEEGGLWGLGRKREKTVPSLKKPKRRIESKERRPCQRENPWENLHSTKGRELQKKEKEIGDQRSKEVVTSEVT